MKEKLFWTLWALWFVVVISAGVGLARWGFAMESVFWGGCAIGLGFVGTAAGVLGLLGCLGILLMCLMDQFRSGPDNCMTYVMATVEEAVRGRRSELYNQAYLAAIPTLVKLGHTPEDIAHLADRIATQSMVCLK